MSTLDQLPPGARAIIQAVRASGPIAQRLREMGILEGVTVRMVGAAPLGDPLELELHGYRLSLRRREARLLEIGPLR